MEINGKQLSLFENEVNDSSNKFEGILWSYSRRSSLEQCARRYYFEYFGANKRKAKSEPQKDKLHFLKYRVQNRYQRSGSILHLVIATYFRKAIQGVRWDQEQVMDWAQSLFKKDMSYSMNDPKGEVTLTEQYPPFLLKEYYCCHPKAEEMCSDELERLKKGINSFFSEPVFQNLRIFGVSSKSLVEHSIGDLNFPFKVSGKIDLAFPKNDEVHVIDWKLGASRGLGDNSLQLAVYGIWAIKYFNVDSDKLIISKAHLSSNQVDTFTSNDDSLEKAKTRIKQDAEKMLFLQSYGEEGVVEAFSPCLISNVCNNCVFEVLCYD